jgi:hypothetical protein
VKILFASQAIDGHFNPMTGVAMELKERGHDVRWYTGPVLAGKLGELGIPLFPFKRAIEHRADNLTELYPERARLRGPRAIGFDGEKIFASNISSFFEDIRELDHDFPFDVLVADSSMFIHRLAAHLLGRRVVGFVVIPNMESDPLVPPLFFGFGPARNPGQKALQAAAGLLSDKVILRPASQSYRRQHRFYGQEVPKGGRLTDEPYRCSDAVIQTGSRSLDFPRRNDNPKVHYVGALLPYRLPGTAVPKILPEGFARTVVVTQGTVDNLDQDTPLAAERRSCGNGTRSRTSGSTTTSTSRPSSTSPTSLSPTADSVASSLHCPRESRWWCPGSTKERTMSTPGLSMPAQAST